MSLEAAARRVIVWRRDPVAFVREIFGATPEPWQAEGLMAAVSHDALAVRSGHGVGKSTWEAWLTWWWLICRPVDPLGNVKVAATAPTAHQLKDILWAEIAMWGRRMPAELFAQFDVLDDEVRLKAAPDEVFAKARTARKEKPEAFQGFHAENMLFLVDEASGVEDIIFEVGEGAMSTKGAKKVLAGNPTRTSGYFWRSHHDTTGRWWTRRVSCEESSRVDPQFAKRIADDYGLDGNVYRVRVLGEFPDDDDDTLIPRSIVLAAQRRSSPALGPVVMGVDVARFGSARTVILVRNGDRVIRLEHYRGLDLMQTAGRVIWMAEQVKPAAIFIDGVGVGAGVVDRVRQLGFANVIDVQSGGKATIEHRFINRRAEMWSRTRDWLKDRGDIPAKEEVLGNELCSVRYDFDHRNRLRIERKEDMADRGLASPDEADALVLTFAEPVASPDLRAAWMADPHSQYAAPIFDPLAGV